MSDVDFFVGDMLMVIGLLANLMCFLIQIDCEQVNGVLLLVGMMGAAVFVMGIAIVQKCYREGVY